MASKQQQREVRDALEAKGEYPFRAVCASCGQEYGAHKGRLCPALSTQQKISLYWQVAKGELPAEVLQFQWRGTFFIPMIEGGDLLGTA